MIDGCIHDSNGFITSIFEYVDGSDGYKSTRDAFAKLYEKYRIINKYYSGALSYSSIVYAKSNNQMVVRIDLSQPIPQSIQSYICMFYARIFNHMHNSYYLIK